MTASAANPRSANSGPSKRPWIFNPWVDLLVGCGAWSLPLMVVTYAASAQAFAVVGFAFYFLAIFCNNPHYMATIYRAYGSSAQVAKYRLFTIYATMFLVLTLLVVHWRPALLPIIFTTYLFWSPWHYTGQNFGLALMMARRAGIQPSAFERNLLYWAFAASFALWILALNTGTNDDAKLLTLGIPPAIAEPIQIGLATGYLGAVGYLVFRLRQRAPWRALLGIGALALTQFLWFVLPNVLPFFTGLTVTANYYSAGILAFMHCAQYLWITAYYAHKEEGAAGKAFSFRRYYGLLVLGGIALFVPGPWLASIILQHDLLESLFIFMALVNIHHFILDGAIWKLRDGHIARILVGQQNTTGAQASPERDSSESYATPAGHIEQAIHWIGTGTGAARVVRWALVVGLITVAVADRAQYWLTNDAASLDSLQTAAMINRNDSRVYFRKALALSEQGRNPEALELLDRAIAINPNSLPPRNKQAELLMQTGQLEAARAAFQAIAEDFKPVTSVLVNAGVLAAQAGNHPEAITYYKRAIRHEPSRHDLHLYIGESQAKSGNPAAAASAYEAYFAATDSHRENETNPSRYLLAMRELAAAHAAAGNSGRAIMWYQQVATLADRNGNPQAMLAAFEALIPLLEKEGRNDEASQLRRIIGTTL